MGVIICSFATEHLDARDPSITVDRNGDFYGRMTLAHYGSEVIQNIEPIDLFEVSVEALSRAESQLYEAVHAHS